MEKRADLRSFHQYLPLVAQSSSLVWPPSVEEELQTMSKGPSESMVNSGEALHLHITNMRESLSLNTSHLAPYALQGYARFFDEKISRQESAKVFGEVVPVLCKLLLQLPSMLETYYQKSDHVLDGVAFGLRLLGPQEAGIVFLSQELIAALLACSFFCLFPQLDRRLKHLQGIKFDELFWKILPLEYNPHYVSYPNPSPHFVTLRFGSSFQFAGDYIDKKELDSFMRRKRRVVAMDAIRQPGKRQYKPDGLLREVNKAFTRYLHQCKHQVNRLSLASASQVIESSQGWCIDHEDNNTGVATWNWGCGVFGGDPELKTMLQWLAISQSGRPFMSYYTFGLQALQNLNQVIERFVLQELTVGDLWNKVAEYSSEKLSRRTRLGFFSWLVTSLST